MPYVYSTLTAGHMYTNWHAPNDTTMVRVIVGKPVFIRGGANLANVENARFAPKGVMTEVTDEQMEYLEQNSVFRKHKKDGLITTSSERMDAEDVAKGDMQAKDNSAPLTPDSEIFKKANADGDTITPVVEKASMMSRVKGAVGLS